MNSKERIWATLNRQPADRTPLDCYLYQKQFVEKLNAEYGSREQFLDEFNIDIFVGMVPWPNQMGHRISIDELKDATLDDPRDPKWLNHANWNDDFGGVNVQQALAQHGEKRFIAMATSSTSWTTSWTWASPRCIRCKRARAWIRAPSKTNTASTSSSTARRM
ncbi:MAG: hypothetical protein HC853_05570 [Anaerolineae bacterium]|nr:hypothetical protein [Anaerolineae bacterium]